MGANTSITKNVAESVTSVISNTIMKDLSECSSVNVLNQGINIENTTGNLVINKVSLNAQQKIDVKCLQDSSVDLNIVNSVSESMKQLAESKLSGLNFGIGVAISDSTLRSASSVANSIDISNVKRCVSSAVLNQVISVKNQDGNVIIENVDFQAVQDSISECIQSSDTTVKAINDFKKSLDQSASSSIEGILGGPLGSIIIGIIALVVLFALYKYFFKGSNQQVPLVMNSIPFQQT